MNFPLPLFVFQAETDMLRIFSIAALLAGTCATSFAATDPSLLALAPADSRIVAAIDVSGSRSSAFGQFLVQQLNAHDDALKQLMEQTGFDPRRDLQFLLLTAASPQNSKAKGRFAVLARGSFDQSRITQAAQKNGSVVQHFQGVDLIVQNRGAEQHAFAFFDADLAVMGDLLSVQQVIQNRSHPVTLDSALQDQISKVEANDAWFASTTSYDPVALASDPELKQSMNHAQILRSITQSNGGIDFGSTSNVVFNAETRSAQDATSLADVVRFVAGMLQTQRGKEKRADLLAPTLDGMKLEVVGSSVHIAAQIPESVLEQLATMQDKPAARSTR